MLESKIQEDTIDLLGNNGFRAYPIEFRGRRGCMDLMVFAANCPFMVCFLELKTKTGKRSVHQIKYEAEFESWGQAVGLTRTPDEALEFCNKVFYGENKGAAETTTSKTMLENTSDAIRR